MRAIKFLFTLLAVSLTGCVPVVSFQGTPVPVRVLDTRPYLKVTNVSQAVCLSIEARNTTFLSLRQGQSLEFPLVSYSPNGESMDFTATGWTDYVVQPVRGGNRIVCSGSIVGLATNRVYVQGPSGYSTYSPSPWAVNYLTPLPAPVVERPASRN